MAITQTPELDRVLQLASDRRATDVFLLPGEPLSLRINGVIQRTDSVPLTGQEIRQTALAAVGEDRLSQLGTTTARIHTSCALAGLINGQMCVASTRGECSIVIRIMPTQISNTNAVRLPQAVLAAAGAPNGLMLFAGPAGSGKTTTMLSVLDHLNAQQRCHICTVEDPIMAIITPKNSLVQQREVGVDAPDVVSGIAAAMRQDPDVLMIGELKTVDEVDACLRVAQTGHLVLTQLHAYSPEQAIQTLIDIQPSDTAKAFRRNLAQVLRSVTAQVLLPRADGRGRLAAYGVLIPDDATRRAIAEGGNLAERAEVLPPGCQTIQAHIEQLRREEQITDSAAAHGLQIIGARA